MNTTALGQRIAIAAHAAHNQVALQPGMLVVEDNAPFLFARASTGGLTTPYDFATCVAPNGNLVRARTFASAPKLQVDTATPANTLTWNAAAGLSMFAPTVGDGLAMVVSSATLYLYYVESGTIHLLTSTDHGTSWTYADYVYELPTQTSGTFVRLAAISGALVFYTSTTTDANGSLTKLGYVLKSSGTWYANEWDLGRCDLGANGVTLADGTPIKPTIGAADLGTGEYVVVFYANQLRGDYGKGVWGIRVSDVTTTGALWSQEEPVYVGQPVADGNGSLSLPLFITHPKLCRVGNEWWCIAIETSNYAGHATNHLAYFRSVDGLNWSDRLEYLAGSDLQYQLGGVDSDYLLRDFLYGQVLVSGTRVFLIGYDMAFVASANRKVGVTSNTSVQLDLTPDVKGWSLSLPRAGEAFSLNVSDIPDAAGTLNASAILRTGARLILKAGYYTSAAAFELLQLAVIYLDRVERVTENAMTRLSLIGRDGIKLLTTWVADAFHSLTGFRHASAANLGGLANAISVANGNFINLSSELWCAPIELDSALVDNLGVFALTPSRDGIVEIKLRCIAPTNTTWVSGQYGGVVLQFQSRTDYYVLVARAGGFTLYKAGPGQYGKLVTYGAALATKTVMLNTNTAYYLLVQQWHHTVRAFYSTDRKTWGSALDPYTAMPNTRGQWGLVGTGNLSPQAPLGWSGATRAFDMAQVNPASYDATKPRVDWCGRIQVDKLCYLRSVTIFVGRMTQTEPDLIVGLVKSTSSGSPADATLAGNIVWQTQVSSNDLPSLINKIAAQQPYTIQVDSLYQLQPGVYWLWLAPTTNLSSDTSANEYYDLYGTDVGYSSPYRTQYTLQVSTDHGKTWNTWAQNAGIVMAGTISVDVESRGVIFSDVNLVTGDLPRSLEDVTRAVVAKAGVLQCSFDSKFAADGATLDTGLEATDHQWKTPTAGTWSVSDGKLRGYHATGTSYAILKTNGYRGTWGDGLYRVKINLLTATAKAGIALRLVNDDPTNLYGYVIELDPTAGTQRINLYRCANAAVATAQLVNRVPPMITIPTQREFTLKVVQTASVFHLFINDCLAALVSFQNGSSLPALALGSFGLVVKGNNAGGAVAEFDDIAIPDLNAIRNDFVIEAGENARDALNRLYGDDRIKFFFRGDGTFRASTFSNRTISDHYVEDYKVIAVSEEDRDTASHVRPRGQNFADRFSPTLLQRWGRRFRVEEMGDATTAEQAYENAAVPLRVMAEQARGATLASDAVLACEVEDAIDLQDGSQYIIDGGSIAFAIQDKDVSLTQSFTLREYTQGE